MFQNGGRPQDGYKNVYTGVELPTKIINSSIHDISDFFKSRFLK
jgi:hypothetical protein